MLLTMPYFGLPLALALTVAACGPGARPNDSAAPPGSAAEAGMPAVATTAPVASSLRPTEAALSPPATVRAGLVGAVPNAGIYVAQERGYFREQGLAVEITEFESATPLVP